MTHCRKSLSLESVVTLLFLAKCCNAQNQNLTERIVYQPAESYFPLWWSSVAYIGGFIKLAYIFAGLLALFVYKHWASGTEPEYGHVQYYHYRKLGGAQHKMDSDLDNEILSIGLKYKDRGDRKGSRR